MPDKPAYRVVIAGSSTAAYSEGDAAQSEYAMLEQCLRRERPEIDWYCAADIIYLTESMPQRTLAAVASHRADVVIVRLVGGQFFNEYVIERIRELAPRLYAFSRDGARWLRRRAGGGPRGLDSPRGWLYRVPRWLLLKTIGTAPRISVEDAIEAVKATLDRLVRLEDVHVVVRLPSYPKTPDTNVKDYERRTADFGTAVRQHCYLKSIPFYDWADVRRRANDARVIGDDRWHPRLDTRELDARTMARAVLAALGEPLTDVYMQPEVAIEKVAEA